MNKKKKNKKKSWSLWVMVALIILAGIYLASDSHGGDSKKDEEITKCIANKSIIYTQLGCHACKTQEEIFGENYEYLNVVDCFYESDKCMEKDITATPTWIIEGKRYIGYRSIEELKEITNC